MALSEVLRLVIEADARGAVSGIEAVGKASERELGRSQKSLDRWGSRLSSVGAGLIGFGSVAAAGLGQAAMAASDLQETVSKSSTIFGPAADGVERFAESAADIGLSKQAALDAASGFGNLFTQVGLSTDSAADMSEQMVRLSSDFASFHNADITEVLEAQQAAFRGEYDALQKFVPTINAAAVEQKALADTGKESADALTAGEKAAATYALILDGAGAAAGDFARTSDSAANKQRKMAAEFENLTASIGQGALPVLSTVVDVARGGIGVFQGLDDATGGAAGKVATFGTVAALGVGALSLLVGQGIKMRQTLADAASAAQGFVNAGGLSKAAAVAGWLALAGAIGQAADAVDPLSRADLSELENSLLKLGQSGRASGEAAELLGEDFENLGAAVERIAAPSVASQLETVTNEVSTLGGLLGRGVADGLDEARATIDDLDKALARLAQRDPAAAAAALGALTDQLEAQGVPAERLTGLLDDYDSAVAEIDTAEATSGTEQLGESMGEQAETTEEATSALQEYQDSLRAMTDPVFAAMDAMTGIRDSQVAYGDALIGVQEAQAALDEAIEQHGSKSAEAAAAQRDLEGAQRAVTDAQWAQVESAAEADAALAGLLDAVERGDVSVDTFRDTLQQWVDQGFYPAGEAADIAAFSVGGLINQADDANTRRVNIPVSETGAGETRNRIHAVRDAAQSVPGGKTVSLFTSGTEDARRRLAGVKDAVHNIPSSKTIDITIRQGLQNIFGGLSLSGARAQGGPVGAGRLYEVAEEGRAELLAMGGRTYLIPGSDGHVIPASAWGGGGSGGGGATYVDQRTVQYHIAGADPVGVIEAIKRYERMAGPGWRQ